jgi:hypothetical protein
MIRHDNKSIKSYRGKALRQAIPYGFDQHPSIIQERDTVQNISEQTFTILDAGGDKISPAGRIIEFPQPDGTPMVNVRIVRHFIESMWSRNPEIRAIFVSVGARPWPARF